MLPTGPHAPVVHLAREARTLGDLFRRRVERSGALPAIYEKREGRWVGTSWAQFYDRAARVAKGLLSLGLRRGERVAILGPTQAPWACYDMGAQLAGLVSLGIYPRQTAEQLRYLIDHSDARVIFVAEQVELERVLAAVQGLGKVLAVVPWEDALAEAFAPRDPRIMPPARFRQEALPEAQRDERLSAIDPDDVAILIYTSGTTGPPKGAMISHRHILSLLGAQTDVIPLYQSDISLNFLPMAHAAERVLGFYGRISTGVATAYASSVGAVLGELGEVRPTLFGSVPRIFEKAYAKLHGELARKPAAVRRLFSWADRVGRRRVRAQLGGQGVPAGLALQQLLADRLVFRRVRAAFGGRVRHFVTGAAPIAPEILEFFWAAGLPIYEAFGMTEATVVTHINRPGAVRLGSVGRPIPPIEQRIAPDGEVLLRGPWVFSGYFKDERASAETVVDGWLHTGDIGRIDEDGFLYITDRKKHLIITAGGKNLTPANIEKAIKGEDPLISHVHAHGDRRAYVAALVAPSPLETLEWGAARGLLGAAELGERTRELMDNPAGRSEALNEAMARVVRQPDFERRILDAVRRGNAKLGHVEQVRRLRILDRDFSQEHGEVTPTMKLRRREVEVKYADLFTRIYEEDGYALEA